MSLKERALAYHRADPPGKLEVVATKSVSTPDDLTLAYSPGVADACLAIVDDPAAAAEMTGRANRVGVISNGTAVLGLGNIGPLASKPVMEGKAVLFKRFAGIDVFDIEIAETGVDAFVDTVTRLEPTFGGINLEDIKAPECFEIEAKLIERMNIPVFHDDQHGTAVVTAAALVNWLELTGRRLEDVRLVCSGAGAAAIAGLDLLTGMGLRKDSVIVADSRGVIYEGRDETMEPNKARYAASTDLRTVGEAMAGADAFLGVSTAGLIDADMVRAMARDPLVLALANPRPRDLPARRARGAARCDDRDRAVGLSQPGQQRALLSVPVPRRARCRREDGKPCHESGLRARPSRARPQRAARDRPRDLSGRTPRVRTRIPRAETVRSKARRGRADRGRAGSDGKRSGITADRRHGIVPATAASVHRVARLNGRDRL